ncbi:MAG: amidohydrolase family protein [Rhizobiaceae bacterium]
MQKEELLPSARGHCGPQSGESQEAALDPHLPIIDPHQHLFQRPEATYMLGEMLADARAGHNIRGTVFIECHTAYRTDSPQQFGPVGETALINRIASECASRGPDTPRIAAGIVAFADLRQGEGVRDVLAAHKQAAPERLRGIRQRGAWDESSEVTVQPPFPPPHLFIDPQFRRGFAQLSEFGLVFDAWVFHPQLDELLSLADAFPAIPIIVDHAGGPIGVGSYRHRRAEVFSVWKDGMAKLAKRPNLHVKLGGLGMKVGGFGFADRYPPASSAEVAAAWRPYIETCIELFGTRRCMFESNFPVDRKACSYVTLWNAFKILTEGCSAAEKSDLFFTTAARFYGLAGVMGDSARPAGAQDARR